MFTLLRLGFWFGLVMLALPLGVGTGDDGNQSSVSPFEAITAAGQAVGDIAALCQRQPEVCETGREALATISVRAKETARIAYRMMEDDAHDAPDLDVATGSVATSTAAALAEGEISTRRQRVEPAGDAVLEITIPVPSAAPRGH